MGETRDDFSKETTRTLGERVGLLCSNAECRVLTKAAHTDDERSLSVGVACHISAAARGGPRYDETQTSDERSAISNGLWLCAKCATLIDKDPVRYPVPLLRQWKTQAEREATERIGKPYSAPREASVVDRLKALPPGTTARLSYVPLNRETPHETSITVEGVDEAANVFRFKLKMGPHPEQSYAAPLRDVENTWCPDGTHHLRLSGYMDHTPLEPYRYVSRGGPAVARVHVEPASSARMSGDAAEIMAHLAREYVKGDFPNHKVWNFSFPIGNAVASELRALRMIETFGSRGRDMQAWRLTDAGQRWVMVHRIDTQSTSPEATES